MDTHQVGGAGGGIRGERTRITSTSCNLSKFTASSRLYPVTDLFLLVPMESSRTCFPFLDSLHTLIERTTISLHSRVLSTITLSLLHLFLLLYNHYLIVLLLFLL